MIGTWLVITPPLLVLLITFVTGSLNAALIVAILCSAAIASQGSLVPAITLVKKHLLLSIYDLDNWYLYIFLCFVGIITVLIGRTGGAQAFARTITQHLNSVKSVENASMLLSVALLIDDYLSNLTVGYIMRPLTDKYNIPRVKLAFLVQSMASPLILLAPVSSWVGATTNYIYQSGVSLQLCEQPLILADPFFVYIKSIPYVLYSILICLSAFIIVQFRISYGPMRTHEQIAQKTGNLFGGKHPVYEKEPPNNHQKAIVADLLVPLITLIMTVFICSAYAGDYWLFGGDNNFTTALKSNTQPLLVMLIASIISTLIGLTFAFIRRSITLRDLPSLSYDGIWLMLDSVIMIFLANILSAILQHDLHTGQYLAYLFHDVLTANMLPLLFFIISLIITALISSSWGVIALLSPIATQMLLTLNNLSLPTTLEHVPLLFPLFGAIFTGAVCGNHISPASETTIMSSTSSGAYPVDHTYTQLPYAVPAIVGSCVGFFITGYMIDYPTNIMYLFTLAGSILTCVILLYALNKLYKK